MRSRLGFAVATAVDPEILLIDEALAVGDARFKERSMRRVESMVGAEDTTVLVVSHSTDELRRLCGRLVLLEGGRKIADGVPDEILSRYDEMLSHPPVRVS